MKNGGQDDKEKLVHLEPFTDPLLTLYNSMHPVMKNTVLPTLLKSVFKNSYYSCFFNCILLSMHILTGKKNRFVVLWLLLWLQVAAVGAS